MREEKSNRRNRVLTVRNPGQCIGCYSCMLACATGVHNNFSLDKSAILIKTSGGYQGRIVVNSCRGCVDPNCVKVCPENALSKREGGGLVFKKNICTGCGKCISGCAVDAIRYDNDEKLPIICIQCGFCAKMCPHNVIEMEVLV